jgi:hypothetical protein
MMKRVRILTAAIAVDMAGVPGSSAQHMAPGMMERWSGMGWFGVLSMMVFWVLVIVGLVFLSDG